MTEKIQALANALKDHFNGPPKIHRFGSGPRGGGSKASKPKKDVAKWLSSFAKKTK